MSLISIITPTYNCENTISETYNSILKQTKSEWEWIVTDDRSTDNTLSILNEISLTDDRVKVYSNDINSGAAVTRNNSIENSSGVFLAFIDSDDVWNEDKLASQFKFMVQKKIDFSFTAYELVNESGLSLHQFVDLKQLTPLSYEDMLRKKATLGCSTVMLRSKAFEDIAMPLLRTGQDYALWLKLLKGGQKAYPLNVSLTKYRITPNSISRNKFKKALRQWQIYRDIERLNISKSIVCFCFYAWRATFRK